MDCDGSVASEDMRLTNAYENRFDVMRWIVVLGLMWALLMMAVHAPKVDLCVRFSGACRGPTASCCKAAVWLGNMGER